MQQPEATKAQLTTILQLQGRLGGSTRFVEPKLALGSHPAGWVLTGENASVIIGNLRAKLQNADAHQVPV